MPRQRKYQFLAMLVSMPGDAERPTVVDDYAFSAVSTVGAKRAASEWYNRTHADPFERLLSAQPADWQLLGAIHENRYCRMTPSGMALVVIPQGSAESDETVREMTALMAEVRRDPSAARRNYGLDDLLARLERYFRRCVDETAGEITDQVCRDADLVYDWPGAPTMLSRALACQPGRLRRVLGQLRDLQCPACGQTSVVVDERCQGGFRIETYYCIRCNVDLMECESPVSHRYHWRASGS
jgi:hypothetical protein